MLRALLVCVSFLTPYSYGTEKRPATARRLPASSPYLVSLNAQANALFQERRYREAADLNRRAYTQAMAENARVPASRFLQNLAGCSFALLDYGDALQNYAKARELAESVSDWESAAATSVNLSSLLLQLARVDGADQEARRAAAMLRRMPDSPLRAPLALQLAKLKVHSAGLDAARRLFQDAIATAEIRGDSRLAAQAWNTYGFELLRAGRLAEAETAISNGFRIRKLSAPGELVTSHGTLALLKLAQHNYREAELFAGNALAAGAGRPDWMPWYSRGRARIGLGRLDEGLADLRTALDLARRFRLELAPADAYRISADAQLSEVASAFVATANRLAAESGRAALAAESFQVAEDARAGSLRALVLETGKFQRMAPEYGEMLARLRAAERKLLAGDDAAAQAESLRLRHEMELIEARAGLAEALPTAAERDLAKAVRQALGPEEALLSFELAEPASWLWAVTRQGLELHPLPGRSALAAAVAAFRDSVRTGGPPDAALLLYDALFQPMSAQVHGKSAWILAVQSELFEAPLAATRMPGGALLCERHSVRIVPSAHFVLGGRAPAPDGAFVAFGDPVYNRADPRARGFVRARAPLELPRLPGSAAEIRAAAEAWGRGGQVLLEGTAANRDSLESAMAGRPTVLHFATHFMAPARQPGRTNTVLSLRKDGALDVVTMADIAASSWTPGVVVLSGCSSARGEIRAGAGLLGLTRAWIAAGAGAVVASLWPTPDSEGHLFRWFYERIREGDSPAEALRRAQVRAIQSGRPGQRGWAAYTIHTRS